MATDAVIEILDSVPADVANRLEKYAKAIDKASRRGVAIIMDVGRNLKLAHDELANHGDGTFAAWVKDRCGLSRMTAWKYMRVVDVFGHLDCKSDLQTLDANAMYFLCKEDTPPQAIEAALVAAEAGERVNLESAKAMVAEYTVDEPEKVLGLVPCIEKLNGYVEKLATRWPKENLGAMSARLRTLADIIDSGEFDGGDLSDN